MARKYYQTFQAECNFQFPVDMLRYDSCFPNNEIDSGKITNSIAGFERPVIVTIGRFVSTKNEQPTIARWKSFGCKISDIRIR